MTTARLAVLGLCLCATSVGAQSDAPNHDDFDDWLAYVLPEPEELGWRNIPWRHEFSTALLDAKREKKPVLLWAMNGHPLGCT